MEQKIKNLVEELKTENASIAIELNNLVYGGINDRILGNSTAKRLKYNNNIDFIKRLESILNSK